MFGGTFDPVHIGHVVVAAEVRDRLGLDRVLLVVAGDPWQKRGQVVASAADRLALARLPRSTASTASRRRAVEVEREGASVTADTLEALHAPDRSCSSCSAPTRSPTWAPGAGSTTPATSPRSWWSSGPATLEVHPPGEGWRVRARGHPPPRHLVDRPAGPPRRRAPDRRAGAPGSRARDPPGGASTLPGDDDRVRRLTAAAIRSRRQRRAADRRRAAREEGHRHRRPRRRRHHLDHRVVRARRRASNTRQVRTIVDEIELALTELADGSKPISRRGPRRRVVGAPRLRRHRRPRVPRRDPRVLRPRPALGRRARVDCDGSTRVAGRDSGSSR